MANPHKGEVEFEAGGRTRLLRLDTQTMCELEAEFDLGILRILAHLDLARMTDVRRIFRFMLTERLSEDDTNAVLDEIGYFPARSLMDRVVLLAFPEAREAADGGTTDPFVPTEAASIGTSSLPIGSSPVTAKRNSGARPSGKSADTLKLVNSGSTTNTTPA